MRQDLAERMRMVYTREDGHEIVEMRFNDDLLQTFLGGGQTPEKVTATSSLIKRVYMLGLRERMELDLEARLMGETLVLNRSLDPLYRDYIELNDLNIPLELKRDQVDNLMPTIKEVENMDGYRDQDMGDIILENRSTKLHVWKQEDLMG
ncbi:hypothetical protein Tco_0162208 [Tanacetum coccineum]